MEKVVFNVIEGGEKPKPAEPVRDPEEVREDLRKLYKRHRDLYSKFEGLADETDGIKDVTEIHSSCYANDCVTNMASMRKMCYELVAGYQKICRVSQDFGEIEGERDLIRRERAKEDVKDAFLRMLYAEDRYYDRFPVYYKLLDELAEDCEVDMEEDPLDGDDYEEFFSVGVNKNKPEEDDDNKALKLSFLVGEQITPYMTKEIHNDICNFMLETKRKLIEEKKRREEKD